MNYFEKFEALQTIYQPLREEYFNEIIEEVKGHFSSPILILVDSYQSPLSQWFFTFFRDWLSKHPQNVRGAKFHQCCLLSYNKGIEGFDDRVILSKELKTIEPKLILNLVDLNIKGCSVLPIKSIIKESLNHCNLEEEKNILEDDEIRLSETLEKFFKENPF